MKINYALISRSLIALLFVVAGLQKVMNFADTTKSVASLDIPLAPLVTLLVIIIEIPIALAFAWGYRTCLMGLILVAFTALVTVMVHGQISQGSNLVMALKNIAIIGGILGFVSMCNCGKCPASICGACKNGKCETHGK